MSPLTLTFWRIPGRQLVVVSSINQLSEIAFCTSSFMALTSRLLLKNTTYVTFFIIHAFVGLALNIVGLALSSKTHTFLDLLERQKNVCTSYYQLRF